MPVANSVYLGLPGMNPGDFNLDKVFNALRDEVDRRLGNAPACRLYHTATQALTHNTEGTLTFSSERLDTDNMHDGVTNPSRITIRSAGIYAGMYLVPFANNTAGSIRRARVIMNGATASFVPGVAAQGPAPGLYYTHISGLILPQVYAVGDYLEIRCLQDSGGSLNVVADGASLIYPEFALWRTH